MAAEIVVEITSGQIVVVELNRGYSGYSGKSGFSGYSGANPGASGYSGYSGKSGYSGISGRSGYSGISGFSGYSGRSAYSGYSGTGTSGFSGYSGAVGASGFSGYSGISGFSGYSGKSGYSGTSGFSGYSAAPAGSNTQVQFNDSSAFGGDAGLTYDKTGDVLTVASGVVISGSNAGYGTNNNAASTQGLYGGAGFNALRATTNYIQTESGGATVASFAAAGTSLVALGSDSGHTDNTVCADSATGLLYKGSGTIGICLGTSSARFKEGIEDLPKGLEAILGLEPRTYRYKKGYGDDGEKRQFGFTAEEVVETLPELVGPDKEGKPNSVDLVGMIPVLVNAIKDLYAQNQALNERLIVIDER